MSDFERELSAVINRHSKENGSSTPDFILARYLNHCLEAFNMAMRERRSWYGDKANPHPLFYVEDVAAKNDTGGGV